MRFKGLKGFTIGKSKEKPEDENVNTNNATAAQIAEMEEKISSRTKGLEDTAQKLQDLNEAVEKPKEDEDSRPKPHGPLSELSVEPEDQTMDVDLDADVSTSDLLDEDGAETPVIEANELKLEDADASPSNDEVKVVEVNSEEATPAAEKTEPKPDDAGDSFNNLFDDEEEEVNPLANLINSLPDVTPQELLDDLDEIKEIMKEWQQS
jgi:hypothetical protein